MIALEHKTQPTPITCVQTCLAMAMDVPVEDVIKAFGKEAMNQQTLLVALSRCGIRHNQFVFGSLIATGWYFMTVPSLNHRGGLHQILLHFEHDTGRMLVLDPSLGARYHSTGCDLISWSDLVLFHPGGRLPEGKR